MLSLYIDGCVFETVGATESLNTADHKNTIIGKSAAIDDFYAKVKVDEFAYWEKVLTASEVMSVYVKDR